MSHPSDNGASQTIDHEASFARIRAELADLDAAIDDLRSQADRLLESASGRVTVAAVTAPPPVAEPTARTEAADRTGGEQAATPVLDDAPAAAGDPASPGDESQVPAFGAIDGADDVAPVFGADAPAASDGADVSAESGGAGVAPVFGADAPVDAHAGGEPAFGVVDSPVDVEEPDASDTAVDETPDDPPQPGFGQAETTADEVEEPVVTAVDAPPTDRGQLPPVQELTPEPLAVVVDETVLGGNGSARGVEPVDWGDADAVADDGAFERFFSDDVEPEPSQRWLLDG